MPAFATLKAPPFLFALALFMANTVQAFELGETLRTFSKISGSTQRIVVEDEVWLPPKAYLRVQISAEESDLKIYNVRVQTSRGYLTYYPDKAPEIGLGRALFLSFSQKEAKKDLRILAIEIRAKSIGKGDEGGASVRIRVVRPAVTQTRPKNQYCSRRETLATGLTTRTEYPFHVSLCGITFEHTGNGFFAFNSSHVRICYLDDGTCEKVFFNSMIPLGRNKVAYRFNRSRAIDSIYLYSYPTATFNIIGRYYR